MENSKTNRELCEDLSLIMKEMMVEEMFKNLNNDDLNFFLNDKQETEIAVFGFVNRLKRPQREIPTRLKRGTSK